MIALCRRHVPRHSAGVSPRLPDPPEPPRPKSVSIRLSEEEFAQLERIQVLLGKHWKRKTEKAEAVRAALTMLLAELESQLGSDRPKSPRGK